MCEPLREQARSHRGFGLLRGNRVEAKTAAAPRRSLPAHLLAPNARHLESPETVPPESSGATPARAQWESTDHPHPTKSVPGTESSGTALQPHGCNARPSAQSAGRTPLARFPKPWLHIRRQFMVGNLALDRPTNVS